MLRAWGSLIVCLVVITTCQAADWFDWRGPNRDGRSQEKGLPSTWSTSGENLLWRVPYGGRSAPVVMGERVFVLNPTGENETLQERVMCLDAESGKVLWEHSFNVYMSDVPPHRVAWASPAGDPETGNVYVFGVGGTLLGLTRDGEVLWQRSLAEEFGLITTHGGRTVSPIVEENLVIVSGITSGWGKQARGAHRFMAFDKSTGEAVWISAPGGRPYDTTYSPPTVAEIGGMRLFIAGGGDGAVHALKLNSGEPVWKFVMSKRGINTGVALHGTTAIVSHSEENIDTNELGLIAAIDASAKGEIAKQQVKWAVTGFTGGFSSPVIDGDRVYQLDNSASLFAFDAVNGKRLWQLELGTIQRASPVLADGKIYVGTENGKFFIIRPRQEKAEILSAVQLGTEANPEIIYASAAVSNGRIFVVSTGAIYCIGSNETSKIAAETEAASRAVSKGPAAWLQVYPAEAVMQPGDTARFHARLFDDRGEFVGERAATWSLENLRGNMSPDGRFTAAPENAGQAGLVRAVVGEVSGTAGVRVISPLPWAEDFESIPAKRAPPYWINATGKFEVREMEGSKVLVKLAENPFTKRARAYLGPPDLSNYTVEVDVRTTERRRRMGDAGVVAQRYSLILFGNHQRLELQSWQPETTRTVTAPFPWKADTWYRLKLRVEPTADGKVRVLGKAWPREGNEPQAWSIERVDPIPNLQGSPGLYADAISEVFFDNLKVDPN